MFNSVRARLTLWYVFVFGLLLFGFSVPTYLFVSRSLYDGVDRSLDSAAQATASELISEISEYNGDAEVGAIETLNELHLPNLYTTICTPDRILASSPPEAQQQLILRRVREIAAGSNDTASFHTVEAFGEYGARMTVLPVESGGHKYFVAVADSLRDVVEQIGAIRRIFYVGFPGTLLVAGIGGFLLAKKSLSPMLEMSEQAQRIGATNLQQRLTVSNPKDELGRLASVFNELLSRLERSFENMREFMADASHELRTPLAIVRGEADVALSQDRDRAEYKETLTIIQDEARRLSRIVDDMLALARADAGQRPLDVQDFYLNDLLDEAGRAMQVLAMRKGVVLTLDLTGDVSFQGDEDLIRRLIVNLLDNAIKYTPSGGSVLVQLFSGPNEVKVIVSDTGVGIAAEAAPYVFERFYRVSKARSRADGGSGLGLAIARWVAEAHKGSIDLTSSPGEGSTFTVSLPR